MAKTSELRYSGFVPSTPNFPRRYIVKSLKKLVYVVVVALGLMATVGADIPMPPDCFPTCPGGN